jgi:hypothetical protein
MMDFVMCQRSSPGFFPAIIGVPQIATELVTGALGIGDALDDLFMNYKIKQTIPLMILRPRFHYPIS